MLALYVTVVLCRTGLADWSATSHIGTNQRVLVICVKWNDFASTRMSPTDWVNLLNNETTHFYDQATYGMTTFLFETATSSSPDGWFNLGYSSGDYDFFKTGQEAINLVDPHVDFGRYDRVLVITNSSGFGGQGGGPWWWSVNEGIEATFVEDGSNVGKRLMTMAIVNEWLAHSYGNTFDEAGSVAAHELGHQLGVPTHYGDIRWHPDMSVDVITPWDIMGLSPTLNHFLGWPKANRGWIPAGSRIQVVGPPVGSNIDTTITLRPQETYTSSPQLIVIPFTNTALGPGFSGYLVENRRRLNGDENLPSEGVLLTLVNQGPDMILPCAVLQDPGSPGDMNEAPLEVGDSYHDDTRNLTITVVSQSGNDYNVRI
jgi:M6 family metalloprotease-like protein